MALHKLVFDTTDSDTIADSSNVGAYLRSDDGTLLTHTTDGSREALDVYTELGQDEDSVHVSGDKGVMALAVRNDAETALAADGDYIPLMVNSSGRLLTETQLDVDFDYVYDEDTAHTTGDQGAYVLAVQQNTLAASADDGDYASFKVNGTGELYVVDTSGNALLTTIDADTSVIAGDTTSIDATLTALSKAEDSIHISGDQGIMGLAVRNDAGTALAADGDYIPFTTDSTGALRVTGGGTDTALADTAIANAANSLDVANTAEDVVASPLTARKYLFVYNNGNREVYLGATGVTSANGFPLPPGSILEMRAGDSIDIEWVGPNTSQEIRTLELS